jgi:hypothetical protein
LQNIPVSPVEYFIDSKIILEITLSDRGTLVEWIFRDWVPRSCDYIEPHFGIFQAMLSSWLFLRALLYYPLSSLSVSFILTLVSLFITVIPRLTSDPANEFFV